MGGCPGDRFGFVCSTAVGLCAAVRCCAPLSATERAAIPIAAHPFRESLIVPPVKKGSLPIHGRAARQGDQRRNNFAPSFVFGWKSTKNLLSAGHFPFDARCAARAQSRSALWAFTATPSSATANIPV